MTDLFSTQVVVRGDCLERMKEMDPCSIDCILTDSPYGISFMGKDWDAGVPGVEFWKAALRVCKPGAMMLAFGGTRTYHRLACAIEDAGWEIRDCMQWIYASGFPKSHNFGCKCKGDAVPYNHDKTTESSPKSSMRPMQDSDVSSPVSVKASEDEILFDGLQEQGLQGHRSMPEQGLKDGKESSMEGRCDLQEDEGKLHRPEVCKMSDGVPSDGSKGRIHHGTSIDHGQTSQQDASKNGSSASQRSQYPKQCDSESRVIQDQQSPQERRRPTCPRCGGLVTFKGFGTALKPAHEPILVCMKPLDGTFAANAQKWGVAGINVDACRIEGEKPSVPNPTTKGGIYSTLQGRNGEMSDNSKGRWPANVIFDEVAGKMLDEMSGESKSSKNKESDVRYRTGVYGSEAYAGTGYIGDHSPENSHNDSGGASRFFYCAKASKSERGEDNVHPTVKPTKLLEYLLKLIMPPFEDAVVLDPFVGSGSTLVAAKSLGFNAVGIEISDEYADIAEKRIA